MSDLEQCEWIEVLFKACRAVAEQETEELPALRDFDPATAYQMISQLFHGVLKDHVPADLFGRVEKQARVASTRLSDLSDVRKTEKPAQKEGPQMELEL